MQNKLKIITCLLLLLGSVMACNEAKKDCVKSDVEDQHSAKRNSEPELTLLMRAMFDEAQQIKEQIANKEPLSFTLNHEEILTAHATEPEKAASAEYKAFAEAYLHTVKSLQTADSNEVVDRFENMVVGCMSCHQAMCPGPLVKIKKLRQL